MMEGAHPVFLIIGSFMIGLFIIGLILNALISIWVNGPPRRGCELDQGRPGPEQVRPFAYFLGDLGVHGLSVMEAF